MLRIVFALLLAANLGYYLWSHGQLAGLGLEPAADAEPQRLERQIRPEALQIVAGQADAAQPQAAAEPASDTPVPAEPAPVAQAPAAPAPAAPEPAPAASAPKEPVSCLQSGGLDERQADHLRRALAALPRGQWQLDASQQSGRWMVYMGKFPDAEFLDRKRGELRAMNVEFDRAGGNFEPGLSLGRFSSEEAAGRQLATLSRQGVRTARVVQERPDVTTYALRLPKATPTLRNEVAALAGKNLVPKALQACAK